MSNLICPGCLFLGNKHILLPQKVLYCSACLLAFKQASDPQWAQLYGTFKSHLKSGVKCPECQRFIPKSYVSETVCPYPDCCFVGETILLKRMLHPTSTDGNLTPDIVQNKSKDFIRINDVLNEMIHTLSYKKNNLTTKHKIFACQAIQNLLEEDSIGVSNYLLRQSRSGGMQHRLFQEYVNIVENSFPILFREKKSIKSITSLLDVQLNIFSGLSIFDGVINNLIIRNETKEFYIGGRKASYSQPYYLGKVLNITDENNNSLMDKVVEYSFSKIIMRDVESQKVKVSHLSIIPHYQMGAMSHINRIRKEVIQKVYEKEKSESIKN